jgi:hypothetical protein
MGLAKKNAQRAGRRVVRNFEKMCFEILGHCGRQSRNRIQAVNIPGTVRMDATRFNAIVRLAEFAQATVRPKPPFQVEDRDVMMFPLLRQFCSLPVFDSGRVTRAAEVA